MSWGEVSSKDRISELASWERDTLQAKHGINLGLEYTHSLGFALLEDYDRSSSVLSDGFAISRLLCPSASR